MSISRSYVVRWFSDGDRKQLRYKYYRWERRAHMRTRGINSYLVGYLINDEKVLDSEKYDE